MAQTSRLYEICVASYAGLWFLRANGLDISLQGERYLKGQFVNKFYEFEQNKFIACVWDTQEYNIIDRNQQSIIKTIKHPLGEFRCWGLTVFPRIKNLMISRDNLGLWIIDLKNAKSYCLSKDLELMKHNLFGHGSILEVEESFQEFKYFLTTVTHSNQLGEANVCKYGITEETEKALKQLSKE